MNVSTLGTSTAGLMAGGTPPTTGATEEWGGSTWANGGSLSTARYGLATMGTQTAALAAGGESPYMTNVEEYNGSAWTSGTNMPTATSNAYRVGNSTTDLYVAGGYTPSATTTTHKWNGTSWTTSGAMGRTATGSGGSFSGSPTAGLAFGGSTPSPSINTTEEFNASTNEITGAAWANGGSMSTARGNMATGGTQTETFAAGGGAPSATNNTEEYNGSGWASETAMPGSRGDIYGSFGTSTAGVVVGGYDAAPGAALSTTLEYNGSSWTAGGNMNTTGRDRTGGGIQTAAIGANAYIPGSQAEPNAETYNGSAWSNITGTGTARYEGMGFGTQTAMVSCGGRNPPTTNLTATEEWNAGQSIGAWSTGGSLPAANTNLAGAGTVTAGLAFGGYIAPLSPAYTNSTN